MLRPDRLPMNVRSFADSGLDGDVVKVSDHSLSGHIVSAKGHEGSREAKSPCGGFVREHRGIERRAQWFKPAVGRVGKLQAFACERNGEPDRVGTQGERRAFDPGVITVPARKQGQLAAHLRVERDHRVVELFVVIEGEEPRHLLERRRMARKAGLEALMGRGDALSHEALAVSGAWRFLPPKP